MLKAQRLSSACVCTCGWPVAIGTVQLCSRQVQPRQPSCDHGRLCPLGTAGAQLDGSIAHGALLLILWAEQRLISVSAIVLKPAYGPVQIRVRQWASTVLSCCYKGHHAFKICVYIFNTRPAQPQHMYLLQQAEAIAQLR